MSGKAVLLPAMALIGLDVGRPGADSGPSLQGGRKVPGYDQRFQIRRIEPGSRRGQPAQQKFHESARSARPVLYPLHPALCHPVAGTYFVFGAWLYVALRVAHSLIHLTYNNVMHRLIAFAVSNPVLAGLWFTLMFAVAV
jgi:hypothetical protein